MQHIVLVKFKPETTAEKIDEVFSVIAELQNKIDGIENFQGGPYSSHEGLNQGYTHGFIMTFADAAARDAYLPHPEHEVAKSAVFPFVEAVVSFDFECA
jgi:hypothetical protein